MISSLKCYRTGSFNFDHQTRNAINDNSLVVAFLAYIFVVFMFTLFHDTIDAGWICKSTVALMGLFVFCFNYGLRFGGDWRGYGRPNDIDFRNSGPYFLYVACSL